MEEILASIRRIISEDDAPAAAEPAAAEPEAAAPVAAPVAEVAPPPPAPEPFDLPEGDEDDVLELTEPVRAEPAPAAAPVAEAPAETLGDIEVFPRAAPAPEPAPPAPSPAPSPAPAPAPVFAADRPDEEPPEPRGLTGAPAADHAASMFGQLSRTLAMPAEGRTLEDVVRELLRPLLKDWLDQNLPGIVEAAVQSEVDRIARLRRF